MMDSNDPIEPMDATERRERLQQQLDAERKMQSDVFGWFLALNGFLFTALGFAWTQAAGLAYVIGALGLCASASWWAGVRVTDRSIAYIRHAASTDDYDRQRFPMYLVWLFPTVMLPLLLGLAWAAVIIVRAAT